MSAKSAYVDKIKRNNTTNLWHMWLGYVSYSKLSIMVKQSMFKGLKGLPL